MENKPQHILTYFPGNLVESIKIPVCFTFPFDYEPHPLALKAATELQHYLETQTDLDHNFGLTNDGKTPAIGKMFGVLVVQDREGKSGYLSAFSGKLAGSNHHPKFVPPVFDMLDENCFFIKEIEVINSINGRIRKIESGNNYKNLRQDFEQSSALSAKETADLKKQLKINKADRKKRKEEQLSEDNRNQLEADLIKQSLYDKYLLNELLNIWAEVLRGKKASMGRSEAVLEELKNERKERSAALQQQLFDNYEFLNIDGKRKNLKAIFSGTASGKPPSAAGECATPKLLQHAFLKGYTPIAMAEFWWGASPKSEIRKHKQIYPACTEKCKPILRHMLEGIYLEEDARKEIG